MQRVTMTKLGSTSQRAMAKSDMAQTTTTSAIVRFVQACRRRMRYEVNLNDAAEIKIGLRE